MAKSYAQVNHLGFLIEDMDGLGELYRYCSPNSILVVTWYGKLKELFCPFGVKVRNEVFGLKKGEYAYVDKVLIATDGSVVFHVKGLNYRYSHFDIITHL